MIKICLFPTGMLPIPSVKGGAIETLINNLIDINEEKKLFKFTVVSIYDKNAAEQSKNYKYTEFIYIKNKINHKICMIIYKILRKLFNIRISFLCRHDYKAYKKIKDKEYDFIIAEGGNYNNFKNLSRKFGKEKMIAHIHHHYKTDEIDSIFDNILTISNYIKNEWLTISKINPEEVYILKNCIKVEKFNINVVDEEIKHIKKNLGYKDKDFVVLYCGRIVEEKGVKQLIEALNNIENENIHLLIVGSPNFGLKSDSRYLQEVSKLSNKSNKIKYTGYIHNDELYKYYNLADVVVMPSLCEEAAGLVAIEAMATGTPLIVTKSGGLIEYVDSTCAIILEKDSYLIENIKKSILTLYNNRDMCMIMGANAKMIANSYTNEEYYNNFSILINEIKSKYEVKNYD